MSEKKPIDHILNVANFLVWQEPETIWGGVKVEDALESFCKLMSLDKDILFKICKGELIVGTEDDNLSIQSE